MRFICRSLNFFALMPARIPQVVNARPMMHVPSNCSENIQVPHSTLTATKRPATHVCVTVMPIAFTA